MTYAHIFISYGKSATYVWRQVILCVKCMNVVSNTTVLLLIIHLTVLVRQSSLACLVSLVVNGRVSTISVTRSIHHWATEQFCCTNTTTDCDIQCLLGPLSTLRSYRHSDILHTRLEYVVYVRSVYCTEEGKMTIVEYITCMLYMLHKGNTVLVMYHAYILFINTLHCTHRFPDRFQDVVGCYYTECLGHQCSWFWFSNLRCVHEENKWCCQNRYHYSSGEQHCQLLVWYTGVLLYFLCLDKARLCYW